MPRSGKTEPVTTKGSRARGAKAQPPAIRGEKRVKRTGKTVPVGPARRARGTHDGPTVPAAIDRRKEFIGTDQPVDPKSNKPAPKKAGGNAGRGAVGLPGRV